MRMLLCLILTVNIVLAEFIITKGKSIESKFSRFIYILLPLILYILSYAVDK